MICVSRRILLRVMLGMQTKNEERRMKKLYARLALAKAQGKRWNHVAMRVCEQNEKYLECRRWHVEG